MTAAHYPNPLIPGFYPDPSVVKVGGDHYLATSTFEYLPGVPVFHSTDLANWELIGHVVERPGQLASYDIPTNGGAWAPTIRSRNGTYYVVITDAMGRGMLIFTAGRPEGPWSDGLVVEGIHGIDPDLAWDDDGVAYITYSGLDTTSGKEPFDGGERPDERKHGGILQITVDLETGKPLSAPRSLWSGTGLKFPEAPHLYTHDGHWYLMIAEGGTERGHGISVARGSAPDGPFEGGPGNPVVSARSTSRVVQNSGHGDLVQAPDGGWAVVMLGMRPAGGTQAFSALGRETFITTVTARGAVASIRQEWSCAAPSGVVTLHLECVPPTGSRLLDILASDIVVLSISGPSGEKQEVARLDGRYLSQETAASFTGRVIGLYTVDGEVGFSDFRYDGVES
jgi:xylan 1,4-beta-xylosidase